MVNLHMMAKRASTPVRDRAIHIVHSYQVLLCSLLLSILTHPEGLSSVVQLSKEALQAIEQAGNDCGGGKRGGPRLNYDDLDPKRRKFLERNRQAAARCRERKKQWIVSLEGRSNVSSYDFSLLRIYISKILS